MCKSSPAIRPGSDFLRSVQVCQSVTGFPSLSVNVPQAIMIRSTSAPMPKQPAVSSQSTPVPILPT